jgi:uncharacterized membrane protein
MINLTKVGLSALIGIVIGALLIAFVEPETTGGAAVLGFIGLAPSLIAGAMLQNGRTRKRSEDSDVSEDA